MKKTVIFIVVLTLTITLLTATPARAHDEFFWPLWPLYAVGVGTAAIVGSVFGAPIDYYPAPPVVYEGGYNYYGGYHREYYGGHYRGGYYGRHYSGGYYNGHYGDRYHGGYYGGGHGR